MLGIETVKPEEAPTITSQIAKCQRSLALNFQTGTVHEVYKAGNKFGLALSKFLAVDT